MIRWILLPTALGLLTLAATCEELSVKLSREQEYFFEAGASYLEGKEPLKEKYRKALAELVSKVDKIEVFLLDFETEPAALDLHGRTKDDQFPVKPYEAQAKILSHETLNAKELAELRPILSATLSAEDKHGGALCHFPIHGVRAWVGDLLVFESSFCWKCRNFAIAYPDEARWRGLPDAKLEQALTRILPIPKSELERFEKRYPSSQGSK